MLHIASAKELLRTDLLHQTRHYHKCHSIQNTVLSTSMFSFIIALDHLLLVFIRTGEDQYGSLKVTFTRNSSFKINNCKIYPYHDTH